MTREQEAEFESIILGLEVLDDVLDDVLVRGAKPTSDTQYQDIYNCYHDKLQRLKNLRSEFVRLRKMERINAR